MLPEKCLVFKKGRGYISAEDFGILLADLENYPS